MPSSVADRAEMNLFSNASFDKVVALPTRNIDLANIWTILSQNITESN